MKHPNWDLQPAVTKLLPEQQQHLIELLKQVGWQRTGPEIFEAIMFPIFPAVPSECAVIRNIKDVPHILMWHRDDEHYTGWHMPGGYMLRGETDFECCARVLKKENGLELKKISFIRNFNTRPETGWVPGHQLARFWLCEMIGRPTNGTFFPLTALPEDTLGHHKKYIEHLRAFFLRRKTMREVGIWYDGWHCAPEGQWICAYGKQTSTYNTLDEAVSRCEYLSEPRGMGAGGLPYHVYDDLGQQII